MKNVWLSVKHNPLPKDGESVVIYAVRKLDKWSVGLAYRNVSGYWNDSEGPFPRVEPAYWMPLPAAPARLPGRLHGHPLSRQARERRAALQGARELDGGAGHAVDRRADRTAS
jgi:hypothetical protein